MGMNEIRPIRTELGIALGALGAIGLLACGGLGVSTEVYNVITGNGVSKPNQSPTAAPALNRTPQGQRSIAIEPTQPAIQRVRPTPTPSLSSEPTKTAVPTSAPQTQNTHTVDAIVPSTNNACENVVAASMRHVGHVFAIASDTHVVNGVEVSINFCLGVNGAAIGTPTGVFHLYRMDYNNPAPCYELVKKDPLFDVNPKKEIPPEVNGLVTCFMPKDNPGFGKVQNTYPPQKYNGAGWSPQTPAPQRR